MPSALSIKTSHVALVVVRGAGADSEALLLRRAGRVLQGAWCHVAGAIEAGEKAWQTAVRELFEETGLKPLALYSADYCEQYYNARLDCIDLAPGFVAFVAQGDAIKLDAEHTEYQWVRFDLVEEFLATPNQCTLFAHVKRYFVDRKPLEIARVRLP